MIDIGLSKMALIGAVALIVIGPEKLPRVARTVGTLLGKAQRYVADVKAEVNRSMELDELRKMKDTVENAARDVEQTIHTSASDFQKDMEHSLGDASASGNTYGVDQGLWVPVELLCASPSTTGTGCQKLESVHRRSQPPAVSPQMAIDHLWVLMDCGT